jgi:hypothetical protein
MRIEMNGMVIEGTVEELREIGVKFPIEEDEVKAELKVGDYAKVVEHDNDNYFGGKPGDIVKIVEIRDGFYRTEELDGGNYDGNPWAKKEALVRATDEEVVQARWAKIGRKPGEFKEGDIVRVTDDCGGRVRVGTIAEVVYIDSDGDFTVRDEDGDDWYVEAELIVPVEQRFDIAAEPKVGARQ